MQDVTSPWQDVTSSWEDVTSPWGAQAERTDLSSFRNRLEKLNEELIDLEAMMRKIADGTFGSQPLEETINKAVSTDASTISLLGEVERQVSRLRNQCNRF